jgi:hypothetical protein
MGASRQFQSQLEVIWETLGTGTNLSPGQDLGGKTLCGLILPTAWDSAALEFVTHLPDNTGTLQDYYVGDGSGAELNISASNVAASLGMYYPLDYTKFVGARSLKIRSGTKSAGVNQTANRLIGFVVRAL